MSNENIEKYWVWSDFAANIDSFSMEFWEFAENNWGVIGDPGFSETTASIVAPHILEKNFPVNVRFTLFRNEEGKLITLHGCYIDDSGEQRPFVLVVHPDYQRAGMGSMMIDFIMTRYMNERGYYFDPHVSVKDTLLTAPVASFVNKYFKNEFNRRNSMG